MHELPDDYQPLPWDVLLLDAQAELPKIGTAIVLAATALEVFIAGILDQLAKEKAVPEELWSWISEREDYHQQPTLVEQYNDLLHFFTGHSLRVLAAPQGGAEQVANPSPPTTLAPCG